MRGFESGEGRVEGVVRMSSQVEYQDGGIVSRTLIDEDAGTVTLFAFDKDQRLSEHTAPFDAIVNVIDGAAEVMMSGKEYRLETGDMITVPAGKPHSLRAVERFKMLLIMVRR